MKKKFFIPLFFVALMLAAWTRFNVNSHQFSEDTSKDKLLMELIAYFMQRGHYNPKDISNDLSLIHI